MSRYIEQKSTCKSIVECRLSALGGSIESVNKLMEFYESHSFLAGLGYGLELAFDVIGNQPTADVVEVVHGEWGEYGEEDFFCTACDVIIENPTPYCPNCGAKMDGSGDDLSPIQRSLKKRKV